MIPVGAVIKVIDNTGVRWVRCLKVLDRASRDGGSVGDRIVVSVLSSKPKEKLHIQKGEVKLALIVETKKELGRINGTRISFSQNGAVLLNAQGQILGTRILYPVTHELREKRLVKILSLAPSVV
uniref:Ribosomal protein L14 n=1 Tax=Mesostigma viride TaxID=41882 RepID=G8DKB5_MESVI|nr:ribosomal protein L14 [Mesostigma viride]